MTPTELGRALHAEIEAGLDDVGLEHLEVTVAPPGGLGAGEAFSVRMFRGGHLVVDEHLSAPMVVAFLADEEGAVNAWREWLYAVALRLGRGGRG